MNVAFGWTGTRMKTLVMMSQLLVSGSPGVGPYTATITPPVRCTCQEWQE